eukprot:878403_1
MFGQERVFMVRVVDNAVVRSVGLVSPPQNHHDPNAVHMEFGSDREAHDQRQARFDNQEFCAFFQRKRLHQIGGDDGAAVERVKRHGQVPVRQRRVVRTKEPEREPEEVAYPEDILENSASDCQGDIEYRAGRRHHDFCLARFHSLQTDQASQRQQDD